jgi:hypothetical protein
MAFSNGLITAPISIADVKQALGVGSNDLATLCTSTKINMWARYKPVRLDAVACQDFDDTKPDFILKWWGGQTGNCGIRIPPINLDMLGNHPPVYEIPQGGSSSPFRLGDFMNYKTDAKGISVRISGDIYYNTGSQNVVLLTPIDDGYTITLNDIFQSETDLYFGVQLVSASEVKKIITNNNTIANGGTYIDIDIVNNSSALSAFKSTQTITIIPFLSTVPQTSWSSGFTQVGNLYQIAEKFNAEIKYYTPPVIYNFELTGSMLQVSTGIISITVYNVSNTSQYFRWDLLRYESANKASGKMYPTFTRIDGESVSSGKTVSIAPGGSSNARITVVGSTSVVDYYSDVIEIFWYDSNFGYRTAGNVEITYRGGI